MSQHCALSSHALPCAPLKATQAMQGIASRGLVPDVVSYSALISANEKFRRWSSCLQLLGQMDGANVQADTYSYSAAISACEKGYQFDKALALLRVMKERSLPANEFTYSAVIGACVQDSGWEEALELLRELRDSGVVPNVVVFSSLISACGTARRWEQAVALLRDMGRSGDGCQLVACNAAMQACDASGQWQRALWLLRWAEKERLEPDLRTHEVALHASVRCDRRLETSRLLPSLKTCVRAGLRAGVERVGAGSSSVDWGLSVEALDTLHLHDALDAVVVAAFGAVVLAPCLRSLTGLRLSRAATSRSRPSADSSPAPQRLRDPVLSCQPGLSDALAVEVLRANGLVEGLCLTSPSARRGSRRALGIAAEAARAQSVSAQAVVAWLACRLRGGGSDGQSVRGDCSGRAVGCGGMVDDSLLLPVFVAVDRASHAERQALMALLKEVMGYSRSGGGAAHALPG